MFFLTLFFLACQFQFLDNSLLYEAVIYHGNNESSLPFAIPTPSPLKVQFLPIICRYLWQRLANLLAVLISTSLVFPFSKHSPHCSFPMSWLVHDSTIFLRRVNSFLTETLLNYWQKHFFFSSDKMGIISEEVGEYTGVFSKVLMDFITNFFCFWNGKLPNTQKMANR